MHYGKQNRCACRRFSFVKGLLLALDHNEFELLKIVSVATREMSEGELLQIEKHINSTSKRVFILRLYAKKTASLIASCCAAGAHSAGADKETIKKNVSDR